MLMQFIPVFCLMAHMGNPGGFVITSEEGTFYFAGDTALSMDMKLIGESTKPIARRRFFPLGR